MISVLIPTHNRLELLEITLDSLAEQTCKNFEVIIVDDFSETSANELALKYKNKLNIIYYYSPVQLGEIDALKNAFEKSNGEYLLILHDDDYLSKDAIQEYMLKINEDNYDFIYPDFSVVNDQNKVFNFSKFNLENPNVMLTKIVFKCANIIPEPSMCIKRSNFDSVYTMWGQHHIYPFYLDKIHHYKFSHIAKPIYNYRVHPSNVTASIEGLIERNNGVVNAINSIFFKYNLIDIFNLNTYNLSVNERLRMCLEIIIENLYKRYLEFQDGKFYTGCVYKLADKAYNPFSVLMHYLLSVLRSLGGEIKQGFTANINYQHSHNMDIPWFSFYKRRIIKDPILFNMITVCDQFTDNSYETTNGIIRNFHISNLSDIENVLDNNIIHVINVDDQSYDYVTNLISTLHKHFIYMVNLSGSPIYNNYLLPNQLSFQCNGFPEYLIQLTRGVN